MAHAEVCVQHNAIDAIVAAAQQILIESAQPVRHGGQVTGPLPVLSNCPAGATFSQPGLRKSVAPYHPLRAHSAAKGAVHLSKEGIAGLLLVAPIDRFSSRSALD